MAAEILQKYRLICLILENQISLNDRFDRIEEFLKQNDISVLVWFKLKSSEINKETADKLRELIESTDSKSNGTNVQVAFTSYDGFSQDNFCMHLHTPNCKCEYCTYNLSVAACHACKNLTHEGLNTYWFIHQCHLLHIDYTLDTSNNSAVLTYEKLTINARLETQHVIFEWMGFHKKCGAGYKDIHDALQNIISRERVD